MQQGPDNSSIIANDSQLQPEMLSEIQGDLQMNSDFTYLFQVFIIKIEKNNYIPVKFNPQIKNSFQATYGLIKLRDSFREEKVFLTKALQILKIDGIQNKSLKKAEDVILKFNKFIKNKNPIPL